MKRIFTIILCVLFALLALSCKNDDENSKKLDELFDEKTDNPAYSSGDKQDSTSTDIKEDEDKESEKSDETESDKKEEIKYVIPEEEQQVIINQYCVAEDFYYDMQNQNFELDNMDTVTFVDNGYETVFRRVIISGINSIADLKVAYGFYFTDDFVSSLDFSAYREENEKLYCAELTGSISGAEYTCTVETIDKNNALLIRKQGTSVQRIPAVKNGDAWLFGAVAIR